MLRSSIRGAQTIRQYSKNLDDLDLTGLVYGLEDQIGAVNGNDLKRAEGMLIVQAHTLDALFNTLAQRAGLNMGEHMHAAEDHGACDCYQ